MKRCCPVSDLAGTPVAVTHIKIGSREGAAVIDVVAVQQSATSACSP